MRHATGVRRQRSNSGAKTERSDKTASPPAAPAVFRSRNPSDVNLLELLKAGCDELVGLPGCEYSLEVKAHGASASRVRADLAAPVELIVREALANAIKYAHPTGVPGKIAVDCERDATGGLVVTVMDDGVGLPENFDPACDGDTGFRVMRVLSERLGGSLAWKSTPLGLRMRLRVPAGRVAANGPTRKANGHALSRDVVQDAHNGARLLEAVPAALYQFTDRLFRARSRKDVYNSALDAIQSTLNCARASILLFDDAGVMRFVASRGLSRTYRRAVEGHSPWTRGERDAQPICIADIETADIDEQLKATVRSEGIGALAFVPLVANGELIGKFMAYYEHPHAFADAEINLAVTVARQLGFGIERQRAERASQLLASIIETSDDAIVSKDLNGIVTSWNRGAERIFGYTPQEMVGQSITTLIPPDRQSEEPDFLDRIRRGEHINHYETVRRRKDGALIDVSLTVSPVKDGTGRVIGASKIARDITERKQTQARQELLSHEIQHRTKNLFAVVLAVVSRSFAGKATAQEAEIAVLDRLRSLAQTHSLLMNKEWQGADLAEVVRTEMSPFADRVQIEGPNLVLSAKAAQNFALALHELATNAAKHGALSNATGRVHIGWTTSKSNGSGRFSFRWQERGGPAVLPPRQRGFGSTVLENVMGEYFDVPPRIEFAPGGVVYELGGRLDAVTGGDGHRIAHAPGLQKQG
jgi:PAS domain S-box-containing protein